MGNISLNVSPPMRPYVQLSKFVPVDTFPARATQACPRKQLSLRQELHWHLGRLALVRLQRRLCSRTGSTSQTHASTLQMARDASDNLGEAIRLAQAALEVNADVAENGKRGISTERWSATTAVDEMRARIGWARAELAKLCLTEVAPEHVSELQDNQEEVDVLCREDLACEAFRHCVPGNKPCPLPSPSKYFCHHDASDRVRCIICGNDTVTPLPHLSCSFRNGAKAGGIGVLSLPPLHCACSCIRF